MVTIALEAPKKIGILGGTFDPPHQGHLKLASHFAKCFKLDELLLVPSGHPWQKEAVTSPIELRYRLTEAAAIDLAQIFLSLQIPAQIRVDRIEIERPGPSYAIDTAKALRDRYGPHASLIWLMGADSLIQLPTWHAWKDLIDYVHLAVASRPHHAFTGQLSSEVIALLSTHQSSEVLALEKSPFGRIYLDQSLAVDLSSTELRKNLQSPSQSPIGSDQIPSHALEIITNLGLYK